MPYSNCSRPPEGGIERPPPLPGPRAAAHRLRDAHRDTFSTSHEKFPTTHKSRVANAQSFRRGTVAQTFGGLRGAPAGQSYRTGPYRLTRLKPGLGPCAPWRRPKPRALSGRGGRLGHWSACTDVCLATFTWAMGVALPMFLKGFCIFDFQK